MRKPSEMYPIVEKWHASPLSKQQFCKEEGVPISVLGYWVCHYNRNKAGGSPSQGFAPLHISGPSEGGGYMEVVFSTGARLNIHQRISLEELSLILSKC